MKSVYGSHACFFLQINSQKKMFPQADETTASSSSDPWSAYIYPFDDETLVRELCTIINALLKYSICLIN